LFFFYFFYFCYATKLSDRDCTRCMHQTL
jgi:hypothetical protein